MVEFLTVLLGAIVTGPTNVQLMVNDDVAMVKLRLDEESLGGSSIELAESLHSSAEVTLGGVFGDTISSELTPLLVDVYGLKKLPPIASRQQWFRTRGKPLTIHSTEKGLAEIFIARDPSALPLLDQTITLDPAVEGIRLVR